jgi:hypothetical protein
MLPLEQQNSGTTQRLQAISAVNADVAWASGLGGTFTVTTNGGGAGVPGWYRVRRLSSSATCTV